MEESINPLIKELIVDIYGECLDTHEYIKNKNKYKKGEFPITYLERSEKISIYTKPVIRKILAQLSGVAAIMYVWIQQIPKYGEDQIRFNSKQFSEETKMSSTSLVKARNELITLRIIAKVIKNPGYYWINPIFMFKGSRVKKYPNNVSIFRSSKDATNSNSNVKEK